MRKRFELAIVLGSKSFEESHESKHFILFHSIFRIWKDSRRMKFPASHASCMCFESTKFHSSPFSSKTTKLFQLQKTQQWKFQQNGKDARMNGKFSRIFIKMSLNRSIVQDIWHEEWKQFYSTFIVFMFWLFPFLFPLQTRKSFPFSSTLRSTWNWVELWLLF